MKRIEIAGLAMSFAIGCWLAPSPAIRRPLAGSAAPAGAAPLLSKSAASRIPPRELLEAMVGIPMRAGERDSLRSDLHRQWACRDPLGFLSSREGRSWIALYGETDPFRLLAERNPGSLVRYARENGCIEALETLIRIGDPRANLTLLLENGPDSYPDNIYTDIFRKGEELDPDFHRRISGLPDDRAKKAAFDSVASVMLESMRHDDYLALLEDYRDIVDPSEVAASFSTIVLENPTYLAAFERLPERARASAVVHILGDLPARDDGGASARAILPFFAGKDWLGDHREVVMETILNSPPSGGSEAAAPDDATWKDWALGLPAGENWDYLRRAGVARWALDEPGSNGGIDQLADPELQDAARVGSMMAFLNRHDFDQADKVIALIHHTPRRETLLRLVKTLKEEGPMADFEEFDPFTPEEDG